MDNCIFCKIINNKIPSYKLYEDDICLSFLDITQGTIGHTLVVPKNHYDNLLDINEDVLAHMIKVAKKIAISISKIDGVKGFNILNNCGENAGQSVMHFHIHIIPRYEKEELVIKAKENHKLTNEEFISLANTIKESL